MEKTVTSIFMVPTVGIARDTLVDNGFINAFIKDTVKDSDYRNVIYLLFKPENIDRFRDFLDKEYERTLSIIEDYDHKNGYVVVVYKLDEDFLEDFELVKQGKYSKTSKDFQEQFPKKVTVKLKGFNSEQASLQYKVFTKSPDLIEFWEEKLGVDFKEDYEVWDGFDEEAETLTENLLNIIKNENK